MHHLEEANPKTGSGLAGAALSLNCLVGCEGISRQREPPEGQVTLVSGTVPCWLGGMDQTKGPEEKCGGPTFSLPAGLHGMSRSASPSPP